VDWGGDYATELRESWPWNYEPLPTPTRDRPALTLDAGISDETLRVTKTADPHEELEFVAHEVLHKLDVGVTPADICVVARSLGAYAPWLAAVFTRYAIPFSSSLKEPLLHRPVVGAYLDLARALLRNLDQGAIVDLLRSPRFRWGHFDPRDPDARDAPQIIELLARRGRVLRGISDWHQAIDEAERTTQHRKRDNGPGALDLVRRTLRALDKARAMLVVERRWGERSRVLSDLAGKWLCEPTREEDIAADAMAQLAIHRLARLDALDRVSRSATDVSAEEFLTTLEETLRTTHIRAHQDDDGGVRVLDALQARAIPTEHLFILGLNQGSWPFEPREDPFLPGPIREQLRERTGRPVPLPRLQDAESRFLLGLLMSQAGASVTLTWHERDLAGRECLPSPHLHQLPLAGAGAALLRAAEEPPERSPKGFLHASDALIDLAIHSDTQSCVTSLPELAAEICPDHVDALVRGLELIRITDSWTSESLAFDGSVGTEYLDPEESVSPSFIEKLGQCPQRAFFSDMLRVDPLEDPLLHEPDQREAGTIVHRVLHQIYQNLFNAGDLAVGKQPEEAEKTARGLLPDAIAEQAGDLRRRLQVRHPLLWQALAQRLFDALLAFMHRDLKRMLPQGLRDLRTEAGLEVTWTEDGHEVPIRGTADRILELRPGEFRVSDYKTSPDTRRFLSPAGVARGAQLQIPVYTLALADEQKTRNVTGEVLSVPLRPERVRDPSQLDPRSLSLARTEDLATRALRTLGRLLHTGRFPFHSSQYCRHCPYTVSCRKDHGPSRWRVQTATAFSEYFALQRGE
jgi:ATP-dependent helicase/nuclease subunit B